MMTMLEEQGCNIAAVRAYADYYEHLPGGHTDRSVEAELFNANRLGA